MIGRRGNCQQFVHWQQLFITHSDRNTLTSSLPPHITTTSPSPSKCHYADKHPPLALFQAPCADLHLSKDHDAQRGGERGPAEGTSGGSQRRRHPSPYRRLPSLLTSLNRMSTCVTISCFVTDNFGTVRQPQLLAKWNRTALKCWEIPGLDLHSVIC